MVRYCPDCGEKIEGSPKFCRDCGLTLANADDTSKKPVVYQDRHTKNLKKAYLILGIISIVVSGSIIFGLGISHTTILAGEILLILGGLLLILAYELIYRKIQYVAIVVLGCIFGIAGSFFPTIEAFRDWYFSQSSIIFPMLFIIFLIAYLCLLAVTLLWRKDQGNSRPLFGKK